MIPDKSVWRYGWL